jgi:hypothetical protein
MSVFMQPIYTQTVAPGGAPLVSFNNIPQNYTDLKILISVRGAAAGAFGTLGCQFGTNGTINNSGENYSLTYLQGIGGGSFTSRQIGENALNFDGLSLASISANTFTNIELYIPNYSKGNFKQVSFEIAAPNNSNTDYNLFTNSGSWRRNDPISSIIFYGGGTNIAAGSTFTIYGISNVYDTLNPIAPTIGTVTDNAGVLSVPFTPASNDQAKIYAVTTSPSSTTSYGYSSPINIPVSLNTAYTAQVSAVNQLGSSASSASNSVNTINSYNSISSSLVGAGGTASITFNNIPQNYKNLQIRYNCRMSGGGNDQIRAVFNSDTSSSYSMHEFTANGSTVYGGSLPNQSNIPFIGFCTYSGVTENAFGVGIVDILDYKNTTKFKTTKTLTGYDTNGGGLVAILSGSWRSRSPITSITLTASTGSFVQHSFFELYGIN